MLTLKWLKYNGGVSWIEKINQQKADTLYNEIDRNSLFVGTTAKEDRSNMNVTFIMPKPELEAEFDKLCKEAELSGLRGHRRRWISRIIIQCTSTRECKCIG